MKGLLLKDLQLYLRVYGKGLLFLICLFGAMGLMDPLYTLSLVLVIPLYGIYLAALDENCKWDFYTCTLPVSRRTLVSSRYLFVLLLLLASLLIHLVLFGVLQLFSDFSEPQMPAYIALFPMVFGSLAMLGLLLALNYKFGPSKARVYTMIFLLLPLVLFMNLKLFDLGDLSTLTQSWPSGLSPLLSMGGGCILIFVLSWLWSISIFQKKEF